MGGGYQPKRVGADRVAQAIKDLQRSDEDINRRISGLGIQVDKADAEVIIAAGRSLVVDGSETVGGSLTVTGDTLIEGNLSVPNGSITNAALNAPVSPVATHAQASNFALTTTNTEKARATISVPSGYSQALVFATISAKAQNTTAAKDFLDGYVDIFGANFGFDSAAYGDPDYTAEISNSGSALLTGLGSSFWVRGMLASGAASWSATTSNSINVDAIVLFLR